MGFSGGGGGISTLQALQLTNNNRILLEEALASLKIAQTAGQTSFQSFRNILVDVFSSATGFLNTINVASSTGFYDSVNKLYKNYGVTATNATGLTPTNFTAGDTAKSGVKITATANDVISKVTKFTSSTSTIAYVLDATKAVLGQATFVGDVATFSTPISIVSGSSYYVVTDNGGSAYNDYYNDTSPYPITGTSFNYISGLTPAGADNPQFDFGITSVFVGYLPSNRIEQTNMQTLPFSPSYFMVIGESTLAGTGSVDVDISYDNGLHTQTGISLNTPTPITNTGNQEIIKLNLKGVGVGNTTSLSNFGIIRF